MSEQAQQIAKTLDLQILKSASQGPPHGYKGLLRIGQITRSALLTEQEARYSALFRLARRGWLKANGDISENNRRAMFFELTAVGRKRLREETDGWNRLVAAIATVLSARPEEI